MLGLEVTGRKSLGRRGEQIDFYRTLIDAPTQSVSPALRRLARLAVRRYDRGEDHAGLERVLFPRLCEMTDAEGFVAELETLLREALARGWVAPVEVVEHFCSDELPMIIEQVQPDSAWHALYALIRDDLLPAARALGPERWRLGEGEYAWRVSNMGLNESPQAIAEAAWACLREQQATIAKLMGVGSFADALPRLRQITSVRLEAGEVMPLHRQANARCVAFVREQGLFELPEDFDVPLVEIPPELAGVTHAGNNPAPLFGSGGGSFAVLDVPERHRRAWVEPLAVHEGVPGHYLQSWLWQRLFRARGAAPNFVSFADASASERQDWGAMPAIEGWAVYAEDLMLEAGFHSSEQAVVVANFHAIRCARACIDVGLHTRGWSLDDAARVLAHEIGLDLDEVGRELQRSIRIPTQPLTYFAGWQAIAALVRDSGLTKAQAHRLLLAAGPTLPSSLGGD